MTSQPPQIRACRYTVEQKWQKSRLLCLCQQALQISRYGERTQRLLGEELPTLQRQVALALSCLATGLNSINRFHMSDSTVSHKLAGEMKVRRIAFVAFDGMEIIDLTGPMDVFAYADQGLRLMGLSEDAVYPTQVLAKQPGPVTTGCGLRILADGAYGEIRDDIDTLIILGTPNVKALFADPSLQDWVQAMSTRVRRLVAICTGTFLLAKIGLRDGRRATTHWAYCDTGRLSRSASTTRRRSWW